MPIHVDQSRRGQINIVPAEIHRTPSPVARLRFSFTSSLKPYSRLPPCISAWVSIVPVFASRPGETWIRTLGCTSRSAGALSKAEARAGEVAQQLALAPLLRGIGFDSQHLQGGPQPPVIPALWDLTSSSGFSRHTTYPRRTDIWYAYAGMQAKTLIHIIKKNVLMSRP